MSSKLNLSRIPRPFQVDVGRDVAAHVDITDQDLRALVENTASCAPYLAGLIRKEAQWLSSALDDPDAALSETLSPSSDPNVATSLRQKKRRLALLTALADLGGAWPLEKVTGALTDFADMATHAALQAGIEVQKKRGKLPGEDPGVFVLAMGKMGAHELNYSSDIDLICLFDEDRHDPADYAAIRSALVRAVRQMCMTLSENTADGYVFRTDLRLRPDPSVTPVVMAAGAAERYYESFGRTWERAAFIKARSAAGDIAAGAAFLETLTPFVWRRHLDFAAIQDAHDMRLAIRSHKGTGGPITLEGHNMKLGRGGIREIEFFTQTRQLIAGGRDAALRTRKTVEGLAALAQKDWISEDLATRLTDHYRFARTVEHRIQMVQDAQTHDLPQSAEEFARLAAMMDMNPSDLRSTLYARLTEVHEETEGFFAPALPPARAEANPEMQARWRSYPALRSARGVAVFERIEPMLLARISEAAKPDEALAAFDSFLAALPTGVQLFSLFEANPALVDLLIDIIATSPALGSYLSHNVHVLDAVIGGHFFEDWPDTDHLRTQAAQAMAKETDYESKLDAIRIWSKELHFRIGVHYLRALIDSAQAAQEYATLAEVCISALFPVVTEQFAKKHGPPPGRGAAVIGMGSLGAGLLTPTSDLDLIVVYDANGIDMSEGAKPLGSRTYYARLTQALVTSLTAPTAQGRLYETDMRLRPSGNQGPVATSWESFQTYQRKDAWLWEHLALTRARCVAGASDLQRDIHDLRQEIVTKHRNAAEVFSELQQMRARIFASKAPEGVWDAKVGPGRMQDIELLGQAGLLLGRAKEGHVFAGLDALQLANLMSETDKQTLDDVYQRLFALRMATRLLDHDGSDIGTAGQGGQSFLLRILGAQSPEQAVDRLTADYIAAAKIIDLVVA